MKVEDLMTRTVHTVTPERSLKNVAALLAEHQIGGMPVIDASNVPLGVVSKADIMLKELGELPEPERPGLFRRKGPATGLAKLTARTAGEAMSAPAITTTPMTPVAVAAKSMMTAGINRLPVVLREELVGIITRHDLVRVFARSDAEIKREIREDVLSGLAWPEAIEVQVNDGEVTLHGQADSRLDAETIPSIVRHVLGVVSVESELVAWDSGNEERVRVRAHI